MKFLEWLSQLINICTGGDPDESFSSHAARTGSPWEKRIDRVLGEGHCVRVYWATRARQLARHK